MVRGHRPVGRRTGRAAGRHPVGGLSERQTPSATAASATAAATSSTTWRSNTDGTMFGRPAARRSGTAGGDGLGGGHLHVLGDRGGAGVEGAAEDAGEGQHVVDLVREVAAAGGDDRGEALGDLGPDLGVGVGHGEHDRVGRPSCARSSASMRSGPLTPMNTSAPGMTSPSVPLTLVGVRVLGEPRLAALRSSRPRVTAPLRSAPMMSLHAGVHQDLGDGHAGGADAGDDDRAGRSICLPTILRAFSSAASVTTAVPCWSSWKTGMSRLARAAAPRPRSRPARRCPRG